MTTTPPVRAVHAQRAELGVLTGAKIASNTALRWVGPFLPTLERAFGTTTGTMTGVMGAAELGGLSTLASGPLLDRGHERRVFLLGMAAVTLSSLIALGGSVTTFAIAFAVLVLGVNNLTVAGHAWIGHRVPFHARGRSIGVFETSWAIALLVGAPTIALVIRWFGWRGPYVVLAVAGAISVAAILRLVSPGSPGQRSSGSVERHPIPRSAWPPLVASAATAAAGLGTFVVSGAWLDDAYGVSTVGLGLVAAAFGAVELVSSSTVVLAGDRIGTRRSVLAGLVIVGGGLVLMAGAGAERTIAIAGLLVFLGGFEFAFVSSLTLVTEAAPASRGRVIGLGNALGTVARAGAVVTSGQLYEAFGMTGTIGLAAVATALATTMTLATRI